MKVKKATRLQLLDTIGLAVIPRFALAFMGTYWTVGLAKYSYPEMTLDVMTSPMGIAAVIGAVILISVIKAFQYCCSKKK